MGAIEDVYQTALRLLEKFARQQLQKQDIALNKYSLICNIFYLQKN